MKNLYTILEGIFDEETRMDKIDQDVIIGQLKKKQTPVKYDKLWRSIIKPYDLEETVMASLLDNKDNIVIRIKLSNNLIDYVRICGWGPKSQTYPKCLQFANGSVSEYHIDLSDDFYKYLEDVYVLPKELEWLFEINPKK